MRISFACRASGIPTTTLRNYAMGGVIKADVTDNGIEIDKDSLLSYVDKHYGKAVKGRKVFMFPPEVVRKNIEEMG